MKKRNHAKSQNKNHQSLTIMSIQNMSTKTQLMMKWNKKNDKICIKILIG